MYCRFPLFCQIISKQQTDGSCSTMNVYKLFVSLLYYLKRISHQNIGACLTESKGYKWLVHRTWRQTTIPTPVCYPTWSLDGLLVVPGICWSHFQVWRSKPMSGQPVRRSVIWKTFWGGCYLVLGTSSPFYSQMFLCTMPSLQHVHPGCSINVVRGVTM